MKKNGIFWFYLILIVGILMVNPPILNLVNQYCIDNPLTFGWPTLFLWLEFWYAIMIIDFLVGVLKIKNWDCSQDKKDITPVERN